MQNKPSLVEFGIILFWTASLLFSFCAAILNVLGVIDWNWKLIVLPAGFSLTLLVIAIFLFVFCYDWIGNDPRE